ncbi:MAG: GNAT family N-acetyltransferase [Alteromonadaceae bacterium]|nr:GNAT family N-acetyltransferase [Alteromonadaceae bacterium]
MKQTITYKQFEPEDFAGVIELGNAVHGDNYLDVEKTQSLYEASYHHGINASFVAYDQDELVGFRLTQAAGKWNIDQWCTPESWQSDTSSTCYFKSNTVNAEYRGYGIGSNLLKLSIDNAKKQGATAGLAHIWLASPGNSAFKYFSKCGGKLVKEHPNRWAQWCIDDGYVCPVCIEGCSCIAAEMIIHFD